MVIGAGTMGSGIAQTAAGAGCHVQLFDVSPQASYRGLQQIASSLDREVIKGRVTASDRNTIMSRIRISEKIEDAHSTDVVIEAVKEDLKIKRAVFRQLDEISQPQTLLLTNTSMISITSIAEGLVHPERVAGCHFFNPVPRMELVEVIAGKQTSIDTIQRIEKMVSQWKKTPVRAPDSPGFIVNRALVVMLNEAAFLSSEGTLPDAIDRAMKLGCNFPMGPLELMDLVGIDVVLDCIIALWEQFGRCTKYEPCPVLKEMVATGKLGRKSGKGFYVYP